MKLNRKKIRDILLSFPLTRELSFLLYQKKVCKGLVDRKITALLNGKRKLSEKRIDNLIVSLTSFPQRIMEVKYAVYSLLNQTILPERIILWLAESQFPNKEQDLPEELLYFRRYGFAIHWCEDIKSFKKLIPALERFPDYFIVTADDDLYYKREWLEKMWFEHLKYPDDLICHLGEKIVFKDNEVQPYAYWKRYLQKGEVGFYILGCGGGGIIYHKRFLHADVNRRDLFMSLTPHADDIWFYFMTILNGTKVRVVEKPCFKVKYVNPYREYGLNDGNTLAAMNVDGGLNDEQFKKVVKHYRLNVYSLLDKKTL